MAKKCGVTYGPPGCGKTLAMICAFPKDIFIGLTKSGIDCGSYVDHFPQYFKVGNIEAAIKLVKTKQSERYIFDDATHLFDAEMKAAYEENPGNKFAALDQFSNALQDLMEEINKSKSEFWFNMHAQAPKEAKRTKKDEIDVVKERLGKGSIRIIPGCPKIAGYEWAEKFPGFFSFCAFVQDMPSALGGWPKAYRTGPHECYVTKDRYNITPPSGVFPMNLGELLRSNGTKIDYPDGLDWMHEAVQRTSDKLFPLLKNVDDINEGELKQIIRECAAETMKTTSNVKHIRWSIKDAIDRANLKAHQENLLDAFIDRVTGV